MIRARVAPTLRRAHPRPLTPREVMQGKRQPIITYNALDAHRELRALLACARTLDALHSAMEEPPSAIVACWRDSAGRALARLSRVSRKGERRGE